MAGVTASTLAEETVEHVDRASKREPRTSSAFQPDSEL